MCSVTRLCLTLCHPMDCSPLGSSVHGILQTRILEWVAISYSRPRVQSHVSCTGKHILYHLAIWEVPNININQNKCFKIFLCLNYSVKCLILQLKTSSEIEFFFIQCYLIILIHTHNYARKETLTCSEQLRTDNFIKYMKVVEGFF